VGEHNLAKAVESLDGWEVVDAVDGRRFVGLVVGCEPLAPNRMQLWQALPDELRALVLAVGHEHVTMCPAFEIMPQTSALAMVPSLAGGGKAQPTWMNSPGRTLLGILQLPALIPYTTTRAGGSRLADLPEALHPILIKVLNQTIEAIEKAARDDQRAAGLGARA
jgi:hypothetical protein